MKKALLIIAIIIAVLALVVIGLLGYFGIMPGVSKIFGTDKPRNLGVTYTEADALSANKKTKVTVAELPATTKIEDSIQYSGTKKITITLTQAEFNALLNKYPSKWSAYPISDVQVKIENGTAKASGYVRVDRLINYARSTGLSETDIQKGLDYLHVSSIDKLPFYLVGGGSVIENKMVSLNATKLEIARFPVPLSLVKGQHDAIVGMIEDQISRCTGLDVKSLTFNNGEVQFDGTIPETIKVMP